MPKSLGQALVLMTGEQMIEKNIARQIKEWRLKNGVKQAAFAYDMGVSQATVSRWEKGIDTPSLAARRKIEKIIGKKRSGVDTMLSMLIDQSMGVTLALSSTMGIIGASKAAQELFANTGVEDYDGLLLRHMMPEDVSEIFKNHNVIDHVPHDLNTLNTISRACAYDNMIADVKLQFFHQDDGERYGLMNVEFKPLEQETLPFKEKTIIKVR